jgi:hypothetical protein
VSSVIHANGGLTYVDEGQINTGTVRVETDYQRVSWDTLTPIGYVVVERRAYLNGMLILDPDLSQWLADKIGIPAPPRYLGGAVPKTETTNG